MKSLKAFIGVVVILAIGILIGSVVTYSVGMFRLRATLKSPEQFSQFLGEGLSRKLRLDRNQKARLLEVVKESQARIKEIRLEVSPRLEAIFREAEAEIMGLLKPPQQQRFRELIRRKDAFFQTGDTGGAEE